MMPLCAACHTFVRKLVNLAPDSRAFLWSGEFESTILRLKSEKFLLRKWWGDEKRTGKPRTLQASAYPSALSVHRKHDIQT
jgi:hypothetical protein